MGKPTSIRIKLRSSDKASATIIRRNYKEKQNQIKQAVTYCEIHNCRGKQALKTGYFPLIKDHKTITRRLNGEVIHGEEKVAQSILLPSEEKSLVEFVKAKCRAYQPLGRRDMNGYIMNILKLRKHCNKTLKGRRMKALSTSARNAVSKGKVSLHFWRRFDAAYPDLTMRRAKTTAIRRAMACTKEMAVQHIDELAEELIKNDIMTNYENLAPGEWTGDIDGTRVYNLDETPQAINYEDNGCKPKLYYCPKGEACQKLINENREFLTITPIISLAGSTCVCQVIFSSKNGRINSSMAPKSCVESVPNLLISTTENGYQEGTSFQKLVKTFDKYLDKEKIKRPVVLLSDGHSSRFNVEALTFLLDKNIKMFISPPDTTAVTQPLDQINAKLHTSYANEIDEYAPGERINREVFMLTLGKIWPDWVGEVNISNAFKICGISTSRLSVKDMQEDKFAAAEVLIETTSTSKNSPWVIESPEARKGSLKYYKHKLAAAEEVIKKMSGKTVSPDEVDGFYQTTKMKAVPSSSKSTRLNKVRGSVEGSEVLELAKQQEKEKLVKIEAKEKRLKEKGDKVELYYRCKIICNCGGSPCHASGLKQCQNCKDILKSNCSKQKCFVDGAKPVMVPVVYDEHKRKKKVASVEEPSCSKSRRKLFEESSNESCDDDEDVMFEAYYCQ